MGPLTPLLPCSLAHLLPCNLWDGLRVSVFSIPVRSELILITVFLASQHTVENKDTSTFIRHSASAQSLLRNHTNRSQTTDHTSVPFLEPIKTDDGVLAPLTPIFPIRAISTRYRTSSPLSSVRDQSHSTASFTSSSTDERCWKGVASSPRWLGPR